MITSFSSKYGVARHIYIPISKAGSSDHAIGADWTPAAGDVKISKDGGATANVTNLPTAIAMGNSAIWDFSLTATEMQAAQVNITVADSATKAVDDVGFIIETYGNASAQHAFDLDTDMDTLVDLVWDEVLTGATHNVASSAGRRVRQFQEVGFYGGYIWIDTVGGTAGTTSYENGTDTNPVAGMSDANTLATALTISQFMVSSGSSITLAAAQNSQIFDGENWTLALGGQSISSTHIKGATVSGTCTGASPPEFHECHIGNVTIPAAHFKDCHLEGTVTLPAGNVHFEHCSGNGATVLEFGAGVANTNVNMTDFSGDITINNLGANGTDVLNIRGHGKITFAASCVGGTVKWDGHFTITNNGSGITFTGDDIYNNTVTILSETAKIPKSDGTATWNATALASINAEVDTALNTAIPGSPTAGSINERIKTMDDADLPTNIGANGAGLSSIPWNAAWDAEVQSECADALGVYDPPTNAEMEARTPSAAELAYIVNHAKTAPSVTFTGGTTTTAILGNVDGSAASSINDFYNGRVLIFNAGTLDEQATDITDYDGSTKTATITAVTTAVTAAHTAIMV